MENQAPKHFALVMSALILCSFILQSQASQAASVRALTIRTVGTISSFRFSKTITWPDNTTELVQLGSDGYFVFNGSKHNSVAGFVLATGALERDVWSPQNIALMNKEYAYLHSHGMRLVSIDMGWGFWANPQDQDQAEHIGAVLDAAFNNDMLVTIELDDHFNEGFNCSINRELFLGMTYSQWFGYFWSIAENYPNIVAFSLENEIDGDGRFTAQQIQPYMTWLCGMVRNETNLPVYTKLVPYFDNATENQIKSVILNVTDIPCIDPYAASVDDMNALCSEWVQFLTQNGKSTKGWWVGETNKWNHEPPGQTLDTQNYTIDYLKTVFNYGASAATLYPANYPSEPTWPFFDANGEPTLALESIAVGFNALQNTAQLSTR